MSDEWGENISMYFQRLLPLLSSILLVLLSYMTVNIGPFSTIRPAVGMVCVYYWIIHRSDVFNLFSVYILGFIEDVVSSAPFGSNIFALLVLYLLVSTLSRFFNGKPFVVTWYGFALLSFVALFSKWFLVSVYYSQFLPVWNMVFVFIFTFAAYPFLSLINVFVQNALMKDEA